MVFPSWLSRAASKPSARRLFWGTGCPAFPAVHGHGQGSQEGSAVVLFNNACYFLILQLLGLVHTVSKLHQGWSVRRVRCWS